MRDSNGSSGVFRLILRNGNPPPSRLIVLVRILALVCLGLFTSSVCFSQTPPPNDAFTNATVLTGSDVTFSGTLAGAIVEGTNETTAFNGHLSVKVTQSIWWVWTAPETTILNLQILDSSFAYPHVQFADGVAVYTATNGSPSSAGVVLPPLNLKVANAHIAPLGLAIPVTAGSNYYIQLAGNDSANFSFRLIATNTPVIVRQPQSQAAYSNAPAIFYVLTTGILASNSFQWRLGTNDLPGETAPILTLTNITSDMAGDYSVVVSNATGFTTSQLATLTVSQSNVPISLSPLNFNSGGLTFALTGENGRSYRIQSSTNLVNWAPELNFPLNPYYSDKTSVIFIPSTPFTITVPNGPVRKFFWATPYTPIDSNMAICVNNLQEIRIAKQAWQRDSGYPDAAGPQLADLLPYFSHHTAPVCPRDHIYYSFDSSYAIHDFETFPTCTVSTFVHILEESR